MALYSTLFLFAYGINAHAQYGSQANQTTEPTQVQLEECRKLGLHPSNCSEDAILAKQRLLSARQLQATGTSQEIYLSGVTNSDRYEAQVEWTPDNIGNVNRFHVEILDPNQLEPRRPMAVSYDVKIFKDDKYLLPEATTRNGDSSTDYAFIFLQEGSYTFTIEVVEETSEKIEIAIQVTPEFSVITGSLVAAGCIAIIATLIQGRTRPA